MSSRLKDLRWFGIRYDNREEVFFYATALAATVVSWLWWSILDATPQRGTTFKQ
jgi:hypothetical protein